MGARPLEIAMPTEQELGPRQDAERLEDIREDHRRRYDFALKYAVEISSRPAWDATFHILDAGCGTGYGASILGDCGHLVTAFDASEQAIETAKRLWQGNGAKFSCSRFADFEIPAAHMLTMFEVIEHTPEALDFIERASHRCRHFLGSVPNEEVVPFASPTTHNGHYRHFTPEEFVEAMESRGWTVMRIWGQAGKKGLDSAVVPSVGIVPRTLIIQAVSRNCP